jgi:hypothetical protein
MAFISHYSFQNMVLQGTSMYFKIIKWGSHFARLILVAFANIDYGDTKGWVVIFTITYS